MNKVLPLVRTALCAAALLAGNAVLRADDVTDSIDEAVAAYNNKDYSTAASALEQAVQLIRQKRAEGLTQFLPKAPNGWTSEDDETAGNMGAAAMFGGGVSAKREYNKGDSRVTVTFLTDSPMLQAVMMWANSPMIAASDGGKIERIKGQKAVVKYKASDKDGSINVVVAGTLLVTIEGSELTYEELKSFAEAIDYGKLAAAVSGG